MTERDPKESISRYFQLWNTGNEQFAEGLLHPAYRDHAHPEVRDSATLSAAMREVRAKRPAFHIWIDALLGSDGDLFTVVGRVRDPYEVGEGVVARNWVIRIQEGLLKETWTYRDED